MTRDELREVLLTALNAQEKFPDDLEAYRSGMARLFARAGAEALGKDYSGDLAYEIRLCMEHCEPRRKKQIKSGCSCAQMAEFWLLFSWDMAGAVACHLGVKLEEAEDWRIWRAITRMRQG